MRESLYADYTVPEIAELSDQLCPDGVSRVPLRDLLKHEQPGKYQVKSAKYDSAASIPVLSPGKGFLLGYTHENDGVYPASIERPVIIFDDFTTNFHWVDFPFKVKSSAMKMLYLASDDADLRYVYWAMQMIRYVPEEHARQWLQTYSHFEIPLPPLEAQHRIVDILDDFTNLEASLQRELRLREEQTAFYRDALLNFEDAGSDSYPSKQIAEMLEELCPGGVGESRLRDVVEIKNGKDWKNEKPGDVPVYGTGGPMGVYVEQMAAEGPSVLLPRKGSMTVQYVEEPFWNVDTVFATVVDENRLLPKYFYHAMVATNLERLSTNPTRPSLTKTAIEALTLPLPPLIVQREIVSILDNFTAMEDSVSGEIEVRQKQLEYYRDQVLEFPTK